MLVSETSAAAFPQTRFRVLAHMPGKRGRVLNLAYMPGVAHPWSRLWASGQIM